MAAMPNQPRKHHIVTAGYLRHFAVNGMVTVHRAGRTPKEQGVRAVAYVEDFWRTPEIAEEMEKELGKAEDAALRIVRNIDYQWPVEGPAREYLAKFLAVHMIRLPRYGRFVRSIGAKANLETVAEGAVKHNLNAQQQAELIEWFGQEQFHVAALKRQLRFIATFLASMHWTLVTFDEDLLITCDQPVVAHPYQRVVQPLPHTPESAVPQELGLASTFEAQFTLDPRRCLLLTWERGHDSTASGEFCHACAINCALEAQTSKEWFSKPGTGPPFLAPPALTKELALLSSDLLPEYTVARAGRSKRRLAAEQIVTEMLGKKLEPEEPLQWVRVEDAGDEMAA
jgi:Protein of unknown function (DUF4238)